MLVVRSDSKDFQGKYGSGLGEGTEGEEGPGVMWEKKAMDACGAARCGWRQENEGSNFRHQAATKTAGEASPLYLLEPN